jgi:O-antigen/teichoic acid export membrane protein
VWCPVARMIGTLRVWIVDKQQELIPAGSLRARLTLGALWSVAGAVISRGFMLGASVASARLLGKTQFGELGMIQSTVGMFGVFAGLGLGLTATKYVAEFRHCDVGKAGRILTLSSLAAVLSGGVITLLLIMAAPSLARNTLAAPQLVGPLEAGSILVFLGALNGAQTGALAGFEAFRTIAIVNIWTGLWSFPLIVIGVWWWRLPGAVWGLVAAMAVNWLLNNRALRRECNRAGIRPQLASCQREWTVLYKFSLPAFLASIIVGPAIWVCNTLLVHRPDGYAELGLYTAADRWRLLILFLPTSVFGMVVPILSNLNGSGDQLGFRKVFRANLLLNSGLVLVPAVVVTALARPIMAIYGMQFRAGWPILIILSLSALPEALNAALGHQLIASGEMWWRFSFDFLLAAVLFTVAWVLIPQWGAIGLAFAYCSAFSITSTGLYFFGKFRSSSLLQQKPIVGDESNALMVEQP